MGEEVAWGAMLSGTGLSGWERDDKVSNRLDTSKEAVVSNKDVEKLGIPMQCFCPMIYHRYCT